MTYNFDPDNWYKTELTYLKNRLESGIITEAVFKEALKVLDKQHEKMWERLDGTYQIEH